MWQQSQRIPLTRRVSEGGGVPSLTRRVSVAATDQVQWTTSALRKPGSSVVTRFRDRGEANDAFRRFRPIGYNGAMAKKQPAAPRYVQPYRYPSPNIPMSAIRRFARQIAERFHPDKIILFGSYAYGTPHEESDVDLLVIMPAYDVIDQAIRICNAFDRPVLARPDRPHASPDGVASEGRGMRLVPPRDRGQGQGPV